VLGTLVDKVPAEVRHYDNSWHWISPVSDGEGALIFGLSLLLRRTGAQLIFKIRLKVLKLSSIPNIDGLWAPTIVYFEE
jgi:hypothetical protein